MLVTLFTDATYSKRLSRGAWAAWAKADSKTYRYSGLIKNEIPDIGEGELAAIANGLFVIAKRFQPPAGSRIIVTTDSTEAIAALSNRNHPRPTCRHIANYIWATTRENKWTLDLRHVKGHRGTASPRHAVNTWCDRECRRRMNELLRPDSVTNEDQQTLAL